MASVTLKDYKLPKPLKIRWIAALRSRKYKQGKGELFSKRDGYSYCCLGVLGNVCDIPNEELEDRSFLKASLKKIGTTLPLTIQHVLASFNDGEDAGDESDERKAKKYLESIGYKGNTNNKKGFGAIASWIEKYL